jgi:hypothetical protein
MRLQSLLLSAFIFIPSISYAQEVRIYEESVCHQTSEQYLPGYYDNSGKYIGGHVKRNRQKVSCNQLSNRQYSSPQQNTVSKRTCNRHGRLLSGLIGGGVSALVSKKDAYAWSIPLGVVGGVALDRASCAR